MITSLDHLTPAARAAVDGWMDQALGDVDADLRPALRDEYVTTLCERLVDDASPADVAAATADLRPELAGDPASRERLTGTILGMPYDLRRPTGARLSATLWNPAEERVLVPRAFGVGWDVNVGALAVKAGLIEPDAEDEPFASTPDGAFVRAATVPAALAAAVAAHYLVRGRALPDRLPRHWGIDGRPDAWTSKRAATGTDLTLAAAGSGLAALAARSRSGGAGRAGRMAAASGLAGSAAAMCVARSSERGGAWVPPLVVGSILGPVGVTLFGLARAGRDAERRRDLGR